jgi:SAM-dependent methyltransferase
MKNSEQWRPNRYLFDEEKDVWRPNFSKIYSGSVHIAYCQSAIYQELIKRHCRGKLLDCGCGSVPYYGMYKDQVTENVCIDWESTHGANPFLDEVHDLNEPLPFESNQFDSALCTDVIAHIYKPQPLVEELGRILKPGGELVLATPFSYWISEPPHEHYRFTEFALRRMCEEAGMEVIHLEPYGGRADIMLDVLNKSMALGISNRVFLLFRSLLMALRIPQKNRVKTDRKYPLGYTLVARKR